MSTTTTPRLPGHRQAASDRLRRRGSQQLPNRHRDEDGGEGASRIRARRRGRRLAMDQPGRRLDNRSSVYIQLILLNNVRYDRCQAAQTGPVRPVRRRRQVDRAHASARAPGALGPGRAQRRGARRAAGLSIANASQHLQQMRRAGIVAARRDGKFVFYQLADDAVLDLVAALRRVAERNNGRGRASHPKLLR